MKIWLVLFIVSAVPYGCSGGTAPATQTNTPQASGPPAAARAPDENAALDALRKINEAQATYFKINRRYALTFDELVEAHLLKSEPSAAENGYEFKLRPAADAQTFRIIVEPGGPGAAARHFFMDQKGVIHAETGKEASTESPAVQ